MCSGVSVTHVPGTNRYSRGRCEPFVAHDVAGGGWRPVHKFAFFQPERGHTKCVRFFGGDEKFVPVTRPVKCSSATGPSVRLSEVLGLWQEGQEERRWRDYLDGSRHNQPEYLPGRVPEGRMGPGRSPTRSRDGRATCAAGR